MLLWELLSELHLNFKLQFLLMQLQDETERERQKERPKPQPVGGTIISITASRIWVSLPEFSFCLWWFSPGSPASYHNMWGELGTATSLWWTGCHPALTLSQLGEALEDPYYLRAKTARYRTWVDGWDISHQVLLVAASCMFSLISCIHPFSVPASSCLGSLEPLPAVRGQRQGDAKTSSQSTDFFHVTSPACFGLWEDAGKPERTRGLCSERVWGLEFSRHPWKTIKRKFRISIQANQIQQGLEDK